MADKATSTSRRAEAPYQIRLDDGTWVQLARATGAECAVEGVDDDARHIWSCSRLKNHEGAHVACTFLEQSCAKGRAGEPDEVLWMWLT